MERMNRNKLSKWSERLKNTGRAAASAADRLLCGVRSTVSGIKHKRLAIILTSIVAALLLSGVITVAWFTSVQQATNGQLEVGAMQVHVDIYKYENQTLYEIDMVTVVGDNNQTEEVENGIHTGRDTAKVQGIVDNTNWSAGSVDARYIAITNGGTIDVKSYLMLDSVLGNAFDEDMLNYFYFRISPITVNSALAGDPEAALIDFAENTYNASTAENIATDPLSYTLVTMGANSKIGEIGAGSIKYYVLEYCCYNYPTYYIPDARDVNLNIIDLNDFEVRVDATVTTKQKNAPENDNESGGNTVYVDSSAAFIQAVNAAANNDTIFLMADVEVTSLTILQRVNLNLNGHTLTVQGNLAYDAASSGSCSLVITGSSMLYVWGDLIIDMPNTSFELIGSGSVASVSNASIILGHYDAAQNQVTGGDFYVNCLRDYDHVNYGYTQTAAQVWVWTGAASADYADMEIASETGVMINSNSKTGTLHAASGAYDIAIYNYGEIENIDLASMASSGGGAEQIYILNCNRFTNTGEGLYAVTMPAWAVGRYTSANGINGVPLNPSRNSNARAINAAGATTGWHVTGANYFFDVDIESGFSGESQVIRNAGRDYTVILLVDTDRVGTLLDSYFTDSDNSAFLGERYNIAKLTIWTFDTGKVQSSDFTYIKTNLTTLSSLDLTYAVMLGGAIPSSALQGLASLTELALPLSETSVGASAFYGTSIEFLTISNTITSIGSNAFVVASGRSIYVTWDSTIPVTTTVLNGFNVNQTVLFMYEYLLGDFRTAYSQWAYHAYERYDFFEPNTNGFYKILTGSTAQLVYYRGSLNDSMIPASVYYSAQQYDITTLGEHCFRLSISLEPTVYINTVIPIVCTRIEDGAFYGAKLTSLSLNYVEAIGANAFRNAVIKTSAARPANFAGMQSLGGYAFYGVVLGNPSEAGFTLETFAQNSAGTGGTLDLSGAYTPDASALRSVNAWGAVIKLNNLVTIDNSIVLNAKLYGCTLDMNGCQTIVSDTFNGIFSTITQSYNHIDARNIRYLGGRAFANNNLNTVMIGISTDVYAAQALVDGECSYGQVAGQTYTRGIFDKGCDITSLTLNGWLPSSTDSSKPYSLLGACDGSVNYGTVNLTTPSGIIPERLFYCANETTCVNTIGNLVIDSSTTSIGACAFYKVVIGNTTLDMHNVSNIAQYAFAYAKLQSVTEITISSSGACSIGNYAFYYAKLDVLASLNMDAVVSIGNYAFYYAKLDALTSLDIDAAASIGSYAFSHVSFAALADISFADNVSIGASAFSLSTFSLLTTLDISGGATIGSYAFNSITSPLLYSINVENAVSVGDNAFYAAAADSLVSLNISGALAIGANSFALIANNSTQLSAMDATAALTIGANTFAGLNIASLTVGNSSYAANSSSTFSYAREMLVVTGQTTHIGSLCITGALPQTSNQYVLGAYSDGRLLLDNVIISSGCTNIPQYAFATRNTNAGSDAFGVVIGNITVEGAMTIGAYAFQYSTINGDADFGGTTSIGTLAFKNVYVNAAYTLWSFNSVASMCTAGGEFQYMKSGTANNTTTGTLTMSFACNGLVITSPGLFQSNLAVKTILFGSLSSMTGSNTFFDAATNLTSVYISGTTVPSLSSQSLPPAGNGGETGLTFYVPNELLSQYASTGSWIGLYANGYIVGSPNANVSTNWQYRFIGSTGTIALIKYLGSATSLVLPSSITVDSVAYPVTEVMAGTFNGNTTTRVVQIPESVVFIAPEAFTNSVVKDFVIIGTNPVYTVSSSADYLLLANGGTTLVYFCGARTQTTLTIPSTITTIAGGAFGDAVNLSAITMSSVTLIDGDAFGGSGITTFNLYGATPPILLSDNIFGNTRTNSQTADGYYYVDNGSITINVPQDSLAAYTNALNFHRYILCINGVNVSGYVAPIASMYSSGDFSFILNDDGTATLVGYNGYGGSVAIPQTVVGSRGTIYTVSSIDTAMLDNIAYVTDYSVEKSNGYFSVDENGILYSADGKTLVRFPANSDLTELSVAEAVTRIEAHAFKDAKQLVKLFIPTSALRNMGESPFAGCSDKLELYGGAAPNPITTYEVPDAILPDQSFTGREDDEDEGESDGRRKD